MVENNMEDTLSFRQNIRFITVAVPSANNLNWAGVY
jgi:hypothetical protein